MSDDDRSPRRDGDNDRSRSRERSRSPGARGDKSWRSMLESLYERGDIRRGDIDDRIISDLESLSESDASYVLQRLTDSDLTRVRSMSGFIGGIIRRVRQDGPDRGEVTMESLPKGVQDKLEMLIEEKKLEREEVDHRMLKALMDLPGSSAEEALKRFDQSLDSTIRSRQGFLMGIIKRLRGPGRDDRYGGRDGGYGRDRGYGGDRDRYGGRDRGYGGDRYGGRDRYGGGGDRYRGGDRYGGGGGDRHGGSRRY